MVTHHGSCHCGAVRFEVEAPEKIEAIECNCSVCNRTGYLHLLVPQEKFRLTSGSDHLVSYRFNTGLANHLFCKTCGIKSFFVPRSQPNGYSVNVRCLDMTTVKDIYFEQFNGRDWEVHGEDLRHHSEEME
ncbi:GFA family protein [bacterium]|nr:GFA family protein [bacterium]